MPKCEICSIDIALVEAHWCDICGRLVCKNCINSSSTLCESCAEDLINPDE